MGRTDLVFSGDSATVRERGQGRVSTDPRYCDNSMENGTSDLLTQRAEQVRTHTPRFECSSVKTRKSRKSLSGRLPYKLVLHHTPFRVFTKRFSVFLLLLTLARGKEYISDGWFSRDQRILLDSSILIDRIRRFLAPYCRCPLILFPPSSAPPRTLETGGVCGPGFFLTERSGEKTKDIGLLWEILETGGRNTQ